MTKVSITGRLTTIIILLAVLSAGLSGFTMLLISRQQFASYIDKSSMLLAEKYSHLTESYYLKYNTLDGLEILFGTKAPGNGHMGKSVFRGLDGMSRRILLVDNNHFVVADSLNRANGEIVESDIEGMAAFPVTLESKERIATIYISSPLQRGISSLENSFIRNISRQIYFSIVIVAVLALLMGLILARRITEPMADLSQAIHKVAGGDLKSRVEPKGDKEFAVLANDFNLMAEQLMKHEESRISLVANIAHELRTPLAILRGQLEAVQSGSLIINEEISSSLVDEVIRLTRLVKELETIGLAESGALSLNLEDIEINRLIECILPLRLAMDEDGVEFILEVEEAPAQIKADLNRLTQVLINLLSNAMRHAGKGSRVILGIRAENDKTVFAVQDNGPGIAAEDFEHIFERFYRVDESRNRVSGGTGLGLAIAKSYIEAHGGTIWAESQPGQGSTFYFSLPNHKS